MPCIEGLKAGQLIILLVNQNFTALLNQSTNQYFYKGPLGIPLRCAMGYGTRHATYSPLREHLVMTYM